MGNSSDKQLRSDGFQAYMARDYHKADLMYRELLKREEKAKEEKNDNNSNHNSSDNNGNNGKSNDNNTSNSSESSNISETLKNESAAIHNEYALLLSNGFHRYMEAEKHYLIALKHKPNDAMYLGNYASLLRTLGRYDESKIFFQKCLTMNEKDIQYNANYADLLRVNNELIESEIYFEKTLQLLNVKPKTKKTKLKNKASSEKDSNYNNNNNNNNDNNNDDSKNGDYNGKSKSIGRKRSNSNQYNNKNNNNGNDITNARRKTNSLILNKIKDERRNDNNNNNSNNTTDKDGFIGTVYNNYALLLFTMKKYSKSMKYYSESLELSKENHIRHYNLARLCYETQKWQISIEHLKISLNISNNNHANSNWLLGRIYLDCGHFDKALPFLQKAMTQDLSQKRETFMKRDSILKAQNNAQNLKKLKENKKKQNKKNKSKNKNKNKDNKNEINIKQDTNTTDFHIPQNLNLLFVCDYILCLIESNITDNYNNDNESIKSKINEINDLCAKYMAQYKSYKYIFLIYAYFLAKIGNYQESKKLFGILLEASNLANDHAVAINSRFAYYYFYGLFLHYHLKKYNNAIFYYEKICQLRPKHALSYYHCAKCIIDKWGEIEEKEKEKEKLKEKKEKKENSKNENDELPNDVSQLLNQASTSWFDFLDVTTNESATAVGTVTAAANEMKSPMSPELSPELGGHSDSEIQSSSSNTQMQDYRKALKYLKKCHKLNSLLPMIKDNFDDLHHSLKKFVDENGNDEKEDEKSISNSETSEPSLLAASPQANQAAKSQQQRRSFFGTKDKNQGYITFQSQLSAPPEMSESDVK